MGKLIDLSGNTFGKLFVLGLDDERNMIERARYERGETSSRCKYWKCQCECGNIVTVASVSLTSGKTRSCGCLVKETNCSKVKNTYDIYEDCIVGHSVDGKYSFTISIEDFEEVKKHCWSYMKRKNGNLYWMNTTTCKMQLHQFIASRMSNDYIKGVLIPDHIDRNPCNNKRDNLRIVTSSENSRNRSISSRNSTGKQGVRFNKSHNLYEASIKNNEGKRLFKNFKTLDEAIHQRILWEKEFGYLGE